MFYSYKITNKINGKSYIGITDNIIERWNNHVSEYSVQNIQKPLYLAFRKYGIDNFSFQVIGEYLTREEAQNKEIFFISEYKTLWTQNGYNISEGGSIPSEKNRKNNSERMKINNPMTILRTNKGSFKIGQSPKITQERNEKIRISKIGKNNPMFGKKDAANHMNVQITCEHCGKPVSKGNYHRWHGSNCKSLIID